MAYGARERAAALTPQHLHLIVMPTEACNFRCTYCYEDFAVGRMRPGIVRGLCALLTQRAPDLRKLSLSWFGGEPLLAVDVVTTIMRCAQELVAAHPGLAVVSDMTTNAYKLDDAMASRLAVLGIDRYQISFDGPADVHDRSRRQAGGGGTYARLWDNVTNLARRCDPFEVLIRVHLTRENVVHIPRFLTECAQAWGHDPRFRFFLRPVSNLGGSALAPALVLDDAERGRAVDQLLGHARSLGLRALGPEDLQPVCYAVHANSFVIRADGRVGKCTVALDDPANYVGHLSEAGDLELFTPQMRPWMRGLWTEDPDELVCPMRGLVQPPGAVIPIAPRAVAVIGSR